jgi:hypothetical protein
MPRCYLLAPCTLSVIDGETNTFTLINLLEDVQVTRLPGAPPGAALLPFQLHAYLLFAPDEMSFEYQIRFTIGDEVTDPGITIRPETPRFRVRLNGFRVPATSGAYEIRAHLKAVNAQEWTELDQRWPLQVTIS